MHAETDATPDLVGTANDGAEQLALQHYVAGDQHTGTTEFGDRQCHGRILHHRTTAGGSRACQPGGDYRPLRSSDTSRRSASISACCSFTASISSGTIIE